jgi:hypothetical protein
MTFWWGRVKMRRPGYIWSLWGPCLDDVLMPFGRALPQKYADWSRTSGQVTLPSGRLLPRSPDVIRTVQAPGETVRTLHSEKQKTEEKFAEFNFSQVSFRTHV